MCPGFVSVRVAFVLRFAENFPVVNRFVPPYLKEKNDALSDPARSELRGIYLLRVCSFSSSLWFYVEPRVIPGLALHLPVLLFLSPSPLALLLPLLYSSPCFAAPRPLLLPLLASPACSAPPAVLPLLAPLAPIAPPYCCSSLLLPIASPSCSSPLLLLIAPPHCSLVLPPL